jgi:hypothetical protein
MGVLRKADYYYGSLLSVLINGGLTPALFDKENESRQIFEVSTNNNDYMIYSKYLSSPTGTKDFTWSFTFSDRELVEIKKLRDENKDKTLVFAFICSQKQLSDYNQEIAVVYWDEFIECIDINKKDYRGTARLSVKLVKGSKALRIYGSKRADVLDGKDHTIKIERNRLSSL